MSHFYMRMNRDNGKDITRTAGRFQGGEIVLKSYQVEVTNTIRQENDDTDVWTFDINSVRGARVHGNVPNHYRLQFRFNPETGEEQLILPDGSIWEPKS